ncbi:hypothetical protein IscW_ISCW019592 [Ixodes scapularis]|uniref:Uncharacterized protein n=1 Tax=Ixodes scapularis TaxID=6945 RepID=B7PV83_IXOSC|nr:hypothetical protein IscW_ISCW019592 [Ixodes scapularis]|eukprot:XP_002407536.1 hypothetical protein IscW_ISCW019592 [Ixodes scapularis]
MRNYDCMLRDAKRIFCHLCDCCFSFKKDKSPISPFGSSARFVETTPRFHGFTFFSCVTRSSFRHPSVLIVDYNMVVVTHGSQGSNVSRLGRSVFVCMFKDNTSTPQIYLSVLATVFSHQARL